MNKLSLAKKLLFASILTGFVVFAVVAVAEWRLRAKYPHITALTGATSWQPIMGFGGYVKQWDTYHPTLGWVPLPNYRSDANAPFFFTINSQGLRATREYPSEAHKGIYRIALFGDSCAFGQEVHDNETVAYYLEQMIENCEVLNYGVPAYGYGQATLRLETEGFDKHPDHVVMMVLVPWGFRRDTWPLHHHPKPFFDVGDSEQLLVRNVPVPGMMEPWIVRHSFTAAWVNNSMTARFDAPPIQKSVLIARAVQRRLRDQCAGHDARLTQVNFTLPDWCRVIEQNQAEKADVEQHCRNLEGQGVDTLDLISFMQEMWRTEGSSVEAPAHHLTAKGNRLLAKRIAEHLVHVYPALKLNVTDTQLRAEVKHRAVDAGL